MEPIQVIAIIFAIFAYSRVILRFKDKKMSNLEFLFWSIIWISIIVFASIPQVVNSLANVFGIERPIDLVVYVSIVLLFYLMFRIYVKIESHEQDITKIVRTVAIKESKKKK
ncbi:MAG: DUF2304 family protein [archaeon]